MQDDGAIKAAIDQLRMLEKQIESVRGTAAGYQKTLAAANISTNEGRATISRTAKATNQLEKEQEKLKEAYSETNKEVLRLRAEKNEINKVTRLQIKLANAEEGSYDALSAQYALNVIRLQKMTEEYRKNSKEGRKLTKETLDLRTAMKESKEEIGDNTLNVGDYKQSIKDAVRELRVGNISVGQFTDFLKSNKTAIVGSTQGLSGLNKMLKLFKIALASTGIGLLIVALGTLLTFFTKTQRGIDFVNQKLAGLRSAFNVIIDLSSKVGEGLFNAFSDPKQAVRDFSGFMKSQIVNRLLSIQKIAQATGNLLTAVFERDFDKLKEAGKEAFFAINQGITGLDEKQTLRLAGAVGEVADEITREAQAAAELEKRSQKLRDAQRELNVERANSRKEIKQLNLIGEDQTRSLQEKENALKRALEIEAGLRNRSIELAQEEVDIIQQKNALGESLAEDLDKEAEARQRLADLQTESFELETTLNNKLNVVRQQSAAAGKKRKEEELALEKQLAEEREKAARSIRDLEINLIQDQFEQRIERAKEDNKRLIEALIGTPDQVGLQTELLKEQLRRSLAEIYAERDALIASRQSEPLQVLDLDEARLRSRVAQAGEAAIGGLKGIRERFKNEFKPEPERGDLFDLLGITVTDEGREQLKNALNFAKQQINELAATRVAAAQRSIQAADREVEAAQNALEIEIANRQAGLASSVETRQKDLQDAKAKQQEALKEEQRAQRAQLAIQTVQQASNLITAVSKILATVNFPFNLAATGIMLGSFAATKIKAFQLTKREFSKGGFEKIGGGTHASGNDTYLGFQSEGKPAYAERGESHAIFTPAATRKYGAALPQLVDAINGQKLEINAMQIGSHASELVPLLVQTQRTDTSRIERELEMIRKQGGMGRTWIDGQGRVVEKIGNVTRTYV